MNTIDAIHERKSIRKYKQDSIPENVIEELISAAMSAPSAINKQPWHFIVITDKEKLKKSAEINPNAYMSAEAPLGILIAADNTAQEVEGYFVQDCSAATQNMLLAITEKNLGGVWTGIYPRKERIKNYQKLLNLPENIIPFSLVVIGVPDENPPAKNKFSKEKIHYNNW